MEYRTGDTPGIGRYQCLHCGYIVRLTSDNEKLPACPNCGHHAFEKLEDK
ncbi:MULTISPECIES: zinc ribbon-containing protein [unclassified Adlercreutzia]|nr:MULTISPECIES: zinc ribbon-containing protein [unclassified Adlercreutzia]